MESATECLCVIIVLWRGLDHSCSPEEDWETYKRKILDIMLCSLFITYNKMSLFTSRF